MANKCIIFARVSTKNQDLEQHKKVLEDEAVRLGYRKKDIIYVGEKESGKTLEEDERLTLQEMWDYINQDSSINCVISFEVSRIARKPKICFSVRDRLKEKHVQLIILNPYTKCFKEDWTLDDSANLVFAIFSQMAESEANLFKERSKRGKKKCADNGKYTGGPVKYGYMVAEDNKLIPDPEKSEIVRLIFQLRIEKKYSATQIYYEMKERGIEISHGKIKKMLYDESYTGAKVLGQSSHCVNERALPPIITKEEFDKAQEITELNKVTRTKNSHTWLLKKIFYCAECGNLLVPGTQLGKFFYACAVHKNKKKYMIKQCSNSCQVWTDIIESLVWKVTKRCYKFDVLRDNGNTIKSLGDENKLLTKKIEVLEKQISKAKSYIEKAKRLYKDGDSTYEEWKADRDNKKEEITDSTSKIEQYKLVISRNIERINLIQDSNISITEANKMLENIDTIDDKDKKQELTHRYIQKVTLEYFNDQHDKLVKVYEIGYGDTMEEFVIQNRTNKIFCHAITIQGQRDDFGLEKIQAKAEQLGIDLGIESRYGIDLDKAEFQNGKIIYNHQELQKRLEDVYKNLRVEKR